MDIHELIAARYQLLIQQLAEELDFHRGYKAEIARRLGIHPSYVTRVERGGQRVSGRLIDEAVRRLRLRPAYFTDDSQESPHYRDFVRTPAPVPMRLPPWLRSEGDPRDRDEGAADVRDGLEPFHELHQYAKRALAAARGGEGVNDWHGHAQDAALAVLRLPAVRGAFAVLGMPEDALHDESAQRVGADFAAHAVQLAAAVSLGSRALQAYVDLASEGEHDGEA